MFRIPFFNRHKVVSDEGFTITFVSRHALRYDEGDIAVLIDIDGDRTQMDMFTKSIRAFDSDGKLPDALTIQKIENNIALALEWKGWKVHRK